MAEVTSTREPVKTPPATFTITLSEDEAYFVFGTLGASNQRQHGPLGYPVYDALADALNVAAGTNRYGDGSARTDERYKRAYNGVAR